MSGDTGALEAAEREPRGRAELAAEALAEVLRSAISGSRTRFDRGAAALRTVVEGIAFAERDARDVLVALDADADPAAGERELVSWCAGSSADAPATIGGLCTRIDGVCDSEAVIVADPDGRARRILGLGLPLVAADRVELSRTTRRRGRAETLIAVLACAGRRGLSQDECYLRTYDLAHLPTDHRGTLEVLLTRARVYLGSAGEITRAQGVLTLHLRAPSVLPDPRCAAPVHDRVLRLLARHGVLRASDAARRLGLSTRAVQQALRELADEGICAGERRGRHIDYLLEDTTFSEPTQVLAMRARHRAPAD